MASSRVRYPVARKKIGNKSAKTVYSMGEGWVRAGMENQGRFSLRGEYRRAAGCQKKV